MKSAEALTVLVIASVPGEVSQIRRLLQPGAERGHRVELASSVDDAKALLATASFDVTLLWVPSAGVAPAQAAQPEPGGDGLAAVAALHEAASEVPIVVLTGDDDEALALRALGSGAQDVVFIGGMIGGGHEGADSIALLRAMRRAVERQVAGRSERRAAEASAQQALEQMRRGEQRFRSLVAATAQMIWTTDAEGHVAEDSPSWRAFTGQAMERYLREGWLEALHPDDRERVARAWHEAHASEQIYDVEYRVRHRSGGYRTTVARGTPVRGDDGGVREWVGVNTDITERKRIDQAFRLLAQAGRALSSALDSNATLENVAKVALPEFASSCGVYAGGSGPPLRLATGAHADPLRTLAAIEVYATLPAMGVTALHRVVETGSSALINAPASGVGARTLDALAEIGVTSCLVVPLRVHGRVLGALAYGRSPDEPIFDATDLAFAEELGRRAAVALDNARLFEEARRDRARVEEANRSKDDFLAMVSHELRTPLNAISGWVRMLRDGSLPVDKRERALEIIDRNAQVQTQLIEDLLDVSRVTSGKLQLNVRPLDLSAAVDAALDTVKPAADARGVRVVSAHHARPAAMEGDPERLQQIVTNLLTNAVKFTQRGGEVSVEVRRDGPQLELQVSDDGRGIDPALLPRIFEPFRQVDSGATRHHGGLGLGLSIVKHLIDLHGGTIEAQSEGLGKGATFKVKLPARGTLGVAGASARNGRSALTGSLPLGSPGDLSGLRVLVVDDEPDAREMLVGILETCGVTAESASSAAEAFERVQARAPDVLVSDIAMPGESGYDLIRKVRSLSDGQGGRLPAVALTAFTRIEDRTRALISGFNVHVTKPVDPTELLLVIANLAGRSLEAQGGE